MQRTLPGRRLALTDPGLPVAPELAERLAGAADAVPEPAGGGAAARTAACGYWERRGLATEPEHVVFAPGPGPLLLALLAATDADLVVAHPSPSWYPGPARLLGRRVHLVPAPAECGGVPDPVALLEVLRRAPHDGRPRLLPLSVPDDPTGTLAPPELLHEVCEAADETGLTLVSDETFRDVLHDPAAVLVSPAEILPGHTVVLADLAAGALTPGWPAAMARFPAAGPAAGLLAPVLDALAAQRAEVAAPVCEAAALALTEPAVLRHRQAAARRLHAAVAAAAHRAVTAAGALCLPPQAGFHLYADLRPLGHALAARGITDSVALEEWLPAALGGHRFGDDPRALHVRLATSALYGATPREREAALHAPDPLRVPHVAAAVAELGRAFTDVTAGSPTVRS